MGLGLAVPGEGHRGVGALDASSDGRRHDPAGDIDTPIAKGTERSIYGEGLDVAEW